MEKAIYLVGCGKSKRAEPSAARDLYTGQLFQKSFRLASLFAVDTRSSVYILSALHGVVSPDRVIKPYDLAMSSLGAGGREVWGHVVAEQLETLYENTDTPLGTLPFAVLAGGAYVRALRDGLTNRLGWVPRIQSPLSGLGIGERLAWLNGALDSFAVVEPDR